MQTSTRFFHTHTDAVLLAKTPESGIPNVYTQAEALGGQFTRIVHGLPRGHVANFSPSILKYNDKTFIAWRTQPEPFCFRYDRQYFYMNNTPTDIYIGQLASDDTVLAAQPIRRKPHRLSYEDPRLFVGPDEEIYIQFVASTYASQYNKGNKKLFDTPHVVVCHMDRTGKAVKPAIPPIGNNLKIGETEKNWCFFPRGENLACLYSTRPLVIEQDDGNRIETDTSVLDQVTMGAPTFNSTAPINLGFGNLIFYHWKHMTRDDSGLTYLMYHLGAYLTSPDFKEVLYIDRQPLFTGSLNDKLIAWTDYYGNVVSYQPAVILPFGAHIEDTELVMSLGVNDAFMGVFRCPLENIMRRLTRVA